MTYYIIRSIVGIGYTDSKEVVDKMLNSVYAPILKYTVEETPIEPQFLDRYI